MKRSGSGRFRGTWLLGYNWSIYGCGTYRKPVTDEGAQVLFHRFAERLERRLGCEVSYVAAVGLWTSKFGNAKVGKYNPALDGAYYMCKLASHSNGVLLLGKMDLLQYRGPSDLFEAAERNPYVPEHVKDQAFGQYLAVR